MPGHDPVVHFGRAHVNADHVGYLAASIDASRSWHARAASVAQAGDELPTQFTPRLGVDGGVDGLVRYLQVGIVWEHERQGTRDLLGRPPRLEKLHDDAPAYAPHIELGLRTTGPAASHALQLGRMRAVEHHTRIATDLAADR